MNCIVIDDEETARIIIGQLVGTHSALTLAAEFSSPLHALKYINQNKVDLIFLDIHMPDFTGFDLLQTLKNPPLVILITSDKNFAIEAFEYECVVDYIIKPISQERFQKAVDKAFSFRNRQTAPAPKKIPTEIVSDIYINIDRRLIKISIPVIRYIEASGDYIRIVTDEKVFTVHSTLKKIEDKLPSDKFLKVHRSFVINTDKIIDIEDNSVLIGKNIIPVSRASRPELMKRLNRL